MKKQILFVMAFYCLYCTHAQPVLNKIEAFKVGTRITTYNVRPDGVIAGNGGANTNWNFASLPIIAHDTLVMEILATGATTYGASFPAASYVEKHGDGSLAYIEKSGNMLRLLGFVPPTGSVMWYHDSYTFLKQPFGYQDYINDTAGRGYKLAADTLAGTGTSRTIADGWGTLVLPNKTYNNVLRTRFEQEFSDTSLINSVVTYSRVTSYAWFDTGHYSSLLKIDSVIIQNPFYQDTIVDVQVLKEEMVTGVPNAEWKENVSAFSTDNQIIITGALRREDVIHVSIYDAAGREADKSYLRQQSTAQRQTIDVSHLPRGQIYIARITIARNGDIWASTLKFRR